MEKIQAPGGETRILLHCCCAPCSGAIVEYLVNEGVTPVLFFSNSNIVPEEEYAKRRGELVRYAAAFGLEVVDDGYDHNAWLNAVRGLEDAPERGPRCLECFRFRLLRAARYAAEHGIRVLATTLASSRWKDLAQVEQAGAYACAAENGGASKVTFWAQNWRKGGLQERRNAIIREQCFYNQNFCGCEFSKPKEDKSSNMEIERKFLVAGEFRHLAVSSDRIAQGYLCRVPGKSVRVRIRGDKAYLTIKGPKADGIAGFEWEKEITVADAESLMKLCEGGIIDKTRYLIPASGGVRTWEVDEFHGDNEGLLMAELELGSVDEAYERPDWLGEEVTGDPRYFNSYLSTVPYSKWK